MQEPGADGPWLYLRASDKILHRDIQSLRELKIVGQNFENLGSFTDKVKEDGKWIEKKYEKSVAAKQSLARRLKKMNADIIIGTEIKDIETAQTYADQYLGGEYQAILIEGNDGRGIDICYFVKKDLPFDFEVQSHKYIKSSRSNDLVFSRDLPVVLVREKGADPTTSPLFAMIGTHYKSQVGDTAALQKTQAKRAEQVQASIAIVADLLKKFPDLAIFFGGDFNNDLRRSPEFAPLFAAGFQDSMDVTQTVPAEQRGTQYFLPDPAVFGANPGLIVEQLDGILVNPVARGFVLQAGIQKDIDEAGNETSPPKTKEDEDRRGSDHDAVFLVMDFFKLFRRR